jgi:hypothetical protein
MGQDPAQRGVQYAAECGLLPDDSAERDAQQHVVSELPLVQDGDPLVVEQGAGSRGQGGQGEGGHDRRGRRRAQPQARP